MWKKNRAAWCLAAPLLPFMIAAKAAHATKSGSRRRGATRWHVRDVCRDDGPARPRKRSPKARADIVDTALQAGAFTTLAKALEAADLVEVLRGEGPFTVFAPTDRAFDQLPEGALASLLEDPEKLASVLTYHVVPGRLPAAALAGVEAVKTVQGQSLAVDTAIGVRVGPAYVVEADIECSNGLLHAIDAVLVPE